MIFAIISGLTLWWFAGLRGRAFVITYLIIIVGYILCASMTYIKGWSEGEQVLKKKLKDMGIASTWNRRERP